MYEPTGHVAIRQLEMSSLLSLAKSDPIHVVAAAETILNLAGPDAPTEHEVERISWAQGVAYYEMGRNGEAIEVLREVVQAASPSIRDRASISLALTEAASGATSQAVARLQQLIEGGEPVVRALAGSQLGLIEQYRGELERSRSLLLDALPALRAAPEERRALARVLLNLGSCYILLGDATNALPPLREAIEIAQANGQRLVHAGGLQNLGYAEARVGRLDLALEFMEEARGIYAEAGDATRRNVATLFEDLCETYRFAGLTREALRYARLAAWAMRDGDDDQKQTDAEFQRAKCLVDGGQFKAARTCAARAHAAYLASDRRLLARQVEALMLEATPLGQPITAEDCAAAEDTANELARAGWTSLAIAARIRLAELLQADAQIENADRVLRTVQAPDGNTPPRERLERNLACAMRLHLQGDSATASITDAWQQIRQLRTEIVEPELRVVAGRLADRFRALELAAAIETDDAAAAVESEARWRSLDFSIRRPAPNDSTRVHPRVSADQGSARSEAVMEWAATGERLYRIDVGATKPLVECGPYDQIVAQCDTLRRSLARLLRPALSSAEALRLAHTVASRAVDLASVLGVETDAAPRCLAPTGELVELPWRLLSADAIVQRPNTVLRTATIPSQPDPKSAALIMGPGLEHAGRDVDAFLQSFPEGLIVQGRDATVARMAALMESASFLHVAAHGHFDNHRLRRSHLVLYDGDAKLQDVDVLDRVPRTVVLAVCDAGRGESRVGGGHLGATESLLEHGADCVIAPLCAVPDPELAGVIERFYEALPGRTPDDALRHVAPREIDTAPRSWGTAHALQCTVGYARLAMADRSDRT